MNDIATALRVPPPAIAEALSVRLRRLVTTVAGEGILTCEFRPGGRAHGAGISGSRSHCVHCNQSRMWHEVAASIPDVEWAEALRAAGVSRGGIFDDSRR